MAGAKETPRQKLISLMYLVFITMLALNVSKEVLDGFGQMFEKISDANERVDESNNNIFENIGTWKNLKDRSPEVLSTSINSVPVISLGIRSGVNCILLNESSKTSDNVLIIKVFASPGTPIKSVCPCVRMDISKCSNISDCPTTFLPTSLKKLFLAFSKLSTASKSCSIFFIVN